MFKRLLLTVALLAVPLAFATPQSFDEAPSRVALTAPIEIPTENVILLSNISLIPTLVDGGKTYAVGVKDSDIFKVEVWEGADQAFGIQKGYLAFSRGERLFMANLATREVTPVLPDRRVSFAAWRPASNALGIIFHARMGYGILLWDRIAGAAHIVASDTVVPDNLEWAPDGKSISQRSRDGRMRSISAECNSNCRFTAAIDAGADTLTGMGALSLVLPNATNTLVPVRRLAENLIQLHAKEGGIGLYAWTPAAPSSVVLLAAEAGPKPFERTGRSSFGQQAATPLLASSVSNDESSGATLISSFPYTTTQDTRPATANSSDPVCGPTYYYTNYQPWNTVWYRVVPNFTGNLRVSAFGSSYNLAMAAFVGTSTIGAQVACSNSYYSGAQPEVVFPVTSGQSYLVMIGGYYQGGGTLALSASNAGSTTLATLVSPMPGSVLPGNSVTFAWTAAPGATNYRLDLGSVAGGSDLASISGMSLSATVTAPTNGSPVYVRLWTSVPTSPGISGSSQFQYIDYVYTADNVTSAAITSPYPGYSYGLNGSSVAFAWSAGTGISSYALFLGSTVGGNDIYSGYWSSSLTQTVNTIPTDGRPIYARLWSLSGLTAHYNDYTYTAYGPAGYGTSGKATMTSPTSGTTLSGSGVAFTWGVGTSVSQYRLTVGSALGANDIYDAITAGNTAVVNAVPTDGRTIFVRLLSQIQNNWQYADYTYTAAALAGSTAALLSPSPGTLLASSATFSWTPGTGVVWYRLSVGTGYTGSNNIAQFDTQSATSATINGIPTNGATIYVTLSSLLDGVWQAANYSFTSLTTGSRATISAPSPGTTLTSSTVSFIWTSAGATAYWLDVGTVQGQGNISAGNLGASTSKTVSGIPLTGATIYVRLWSLLAGVWQYYDYTYSTPSPGTMSSPKPGSSFSGGVVTFTWTGGYPITAYWLDVGTAPGTSGAFNGNIFGANLALSTTATVSGIPTDGSMVYVRLWSQIGGAWQFNDYTYSAATLSPKAAMIVPVPGSTFPGATVSFAWTSSANATAYWLDVGTARGQGNLFARNVGLATSQTVAGLPADGSTVYVRLSSQIGGAWSYNDYTYIAAQSSKAAMISPVSGSSVMSPVVQFSWSPGLGATAYWLDVGTTQGQGNIFGANVGTALSWAVNGIPPAGTLYVRLWSQIAGNWVYNDYNYNATGSAKAVMIGPTPGTTVGPTTWFTWTSATGATAYWLDVGTAPGQGNLFAANLGTATSKVVTGIPTTGGTVYVRLWTQLFGTWVYNDYLYAASTN